MKVFLLNPPVKGKKFTRDGRCQTDENMWLSAFPPATFASIAGVLREKHEISVIDAIGTSIPLESCIRSAKEFDPEFVVLNTSTPTITSDLQAAEALKEATGAKIILYGENPTARYEYFLKNFDFLDYIILSEPETPILKIVEGDDKSPGVASREWNGGKWIEKDLDRLPFPAYDLLPPYYFPLTGERWIFIRSGRGCPYNCIYCVMPLLSDHNLRYHSADYMIKQINWILKDLKIPVFMLWDELATFDRERMIRICDGLIESGFPSKGWWICTTRVDKLDRELAKKMRKAGCRLISLGIESADAGVLKRSKKGAAPEQSIEAVAAARDAGIRTIGHFIMGLPGSSEEVEKKTIQFAKQLKLDFAQFYPATPYPGSEFYKQCQEMGWIPPQMEGDIEQDKTIVSYPDFSAERIEYWRKRAYREFYFRPRTIIGGLSMMSFRQLARLPSYVFRFMGDRWR